MNSFRIATALYLLLAIVWGVALRQPLNWNGGIWEFSTEWVSVLRVHSDAPSVALGLGILLATALFLGFSTTARPPSQGGWTALAGATFFALLGTICADATVFLFLWMASAVCGLWLVPSKKGADTGIWHASDWLPVAIALLALVVAVVGSQALFRNTEFTEMAALSHQPYDYPPVRVRVAWYAALLAAALPLFPFRFSRRPLHFGEVLWRGVFAPALAATIYLRFAFLHPLLAQPFTERLVLGGLAFWCALACGTRTSLAASQRAWLAAGGTWMLLVGTLRGPEALSFFAPAFFVGLLATIHPGGSAVCAVLIANALWGQEVWHPLVLGTAWLLSLFAGLRLALHTFSGLRSAPGNTAALAVWMGAGAVAFGLAWIMPQCKPADLAGTLQGVLILLVAGALAWASRRWVPAEAEEVPMVTTPGFWPLMLLRVARGVQWFEARFWPALWRIPAQTCRTAGEFFVYWQGGTPQYALLVLLMGTLVLFWAALKSVVIW